MRKFYHLALVAIVAVAMTSCDMFKKGQTEFYLKDLQGLWLEENADKPNMQHYVRFTDEAGDTTGYFIGREWNEEEWDDPDMTAEEFLIWNREQLGHLCNGWFEYMLEQKGDFHEIHFMDNGGADIPKEYIVAILSDTRLEYYDKDNSKRRHYFNKVVETKQ